MLGEWMTATLEGRTLPETQRIANGRLNHLGPGLLELIPDHPSVQAHACIFSVGIHGNETAPIELLDTCLTGVIEERITLGAPVLMILGNLEAIHAGQRFITTNLNRLFRRDLTDAGKEPDRARELMATVDDFRRRHGERPLLHYDLHTAIRDSRYPRFVVSPFADAPVEPAQWRWLAAADIQAVLHQHQHSWTFSHYTRHYHDGQAFTLELGRALPFGHNDLAPLAPMGDLLTALIEGREPRRAAPSRMRFFRVEKEVMRHAHDFRLCFADDTPNFTEFAPGTLLAEDAHAGETRVGDRPLGVVFPNACVEIGARAALLVSNAGPPDA